MNTSELAVFVYGTLMRGEANHPHFCADALAVKAATTIGRLFHLPAGYPALAAERTAVLARADGDVQVDLALQRDWDARLRTEPAGEWPTPHEGNLVHGEWMTFDDPAVRLPMLDRLEGFRPGRPSLYHRVLVRCWVGTQHAPRAAWTYVQPRPRGTPVHGGRWATAARYQGGDDD